MSDATVWVQAGRLGMRVPEDEGLTTAAEMLADGHRAAAIHTGDCNLGKSQMQGGGTCDCEPLFVGREASS